MRFAHYLVFIYFCARYMYLLPRDTQRNLHFYAPFASPARRSGSGSEGLPPFLCIWEMLDVNDWVTAEYV